MTSSEEARQHGADVPSDPSYDAAAVVGVIAGLDAPGEPLTPDDLIARYCQNVGEGLVSAPGVTYGDGVRIARGFCGWSGYFTAPDGSRTSQGYDDGYSFMGALEAGGWRPLAAKGDWPYVVYMLWRGDEPSIAEYCEADLTVWTFKSMDALKAHYATLSDCP